MTPTTPHPARTCDPRVERTRALVIAAAAELLLRGSNDEFSPAALDLTLAELRGLRDFVTEHKARLGVVVNNVGTLAMQVGWYVRFFEPAKKIGRAHV